VRVRNQRIERELPAEIPDGEADLVITYDERAQGEMDQARRRHLEALLSRIETHSPGRPREKIDRQFAEERQGWER
jgi:hypothetical protein